MAPLTAACGAIETPSFPVPIDNADRDFAISHRLELLETLRKAGAILLKNSGVRVEELSRFASDLSGLDLFDYAGGASPRTRLVNAAYTSTEYPADMVLALHNELSYSSRAPRYLFFLCDVAPTDRGETTLGDSRKILRELDPQTVSAFRSRGIRHERHLPNDGSMYSWQSAFGTVDPQVVEKKLEEIRCSFTWNPEGGLSISETTAAILTHPETGEEVWFNQASAFGLTAVEPGLTRRLGVTFGDGTPIPTQMLLEIASVLDRKAVPHRWSAQDLVIVDNAIAAHGRRPFSGPRRIALAMTGLIERETFLQ